MKVALKYCGGCDPAYERVEYWEQVREAAGGRIEWVTLEQESYEAVLLICGCQTACPVDELDLTGKVIIVNDNQAEPRDVAAALLDQEDIHANKD